jgi:hypothetical protein
MERFKTADARSNVVQGDNLARSVMKLNLCEMRNSTTSFFRGGRVEAADTIERERECEKAKVAGWKRKINLKPTSEA